MRKDTQIGKRMMTNAEYKPRAGRKFRSGGLDGSGEVYGFYVRLEGEAREQFREVKRRMARVLGGEPSNPMVLDFLVARFIAEVRANEAGRGE